MKVLLLKDVRGVGQRGAVVEVKDGFGRNYLILHGLGKVADSRAIREADIQKSASLERADTKQATTQEYIQRLEKTHLEFRKKANEHGHLFAGIKAEEIKEVLERMGILILKDNIEGAPLKVVGSHKIYINIGAQKIPVSITITKHE